MLNDKSLPKLPDGPNTSSSESKSKIASPESKALRRTFLTTSAIGASAVVAPSFMARTAYAAGSDSLRVGLIGCGGRGMGAAKNAMDADAGSRLTAVADIFPDRLESGQNQLKRTLQDRYSVSDSNLFSGWDGFKALIESGVDVVLLATPPQFRPMHLQACIEANKHVFCEKPVAVDPVGVRKVLDISEQAEAKKLNLVSGLCWRYDYGVNATIEMIKQGAIGKIVSIQENYLTGLLWERTRKENWTDMHEQIYNWLYYRWLSGDHISEQFIHSLDKSLWLHDDVPPKLCYGQGGRQVRTDKKFGDVYDHFTVVYEWEDGTRTFAMTRQMENCFSETEDFVYGTEGVARVLKNEISGKVNWRFRGEKPDMYKMEHVALFNSIRKGEVINNGKYMCYSTMMALMGREACYSGKTITWDQMMASTQDLTPPSYAFGPAPEVVVKHPGNYRFS